MCLAGEDGMGIASFLLGVRAFYHTWLAQNA